MLRGLAVAGLLTAAYGSMPASSPHSAATQDVLAALTQKGLDETVQRFKAARANGQLTETTVQTPLGAITGVAGETVNQFLGIPYAQQPVGNLRWRSPQPVQPWSGELNATWWGPGCIQTEKLWNLYTGSSEGCLYLNIYVPTAAPPPGGYPVMLFLHGGSWVFGSGSFMLYDPTNAQNVSGLVNHVIYVTINYRLSVFGFLAGDLLRAESPDGSVGNYGFQDQRMALNFTKTIISSFGGNPNLITLFGESAGGGSTSSHLVSPRSWPYFQRAIIESGAWAPWTAQPYNISATRLPQLAKNLNCSTAPNVLTCMRAVDAMTTFKSQAGLTSAFLQYSPVIDGVELTADPRALLAKGAVNPVPIMLGFNMNEGTLFNSAPDNLNATNEESAIATITGAALAPAVAAQYPAAEYTTPWWAVSAMFGDSQMVCPGQAAGQALVSSVRGTVQPVFVYYYTHILWLVETIIDAFRPMGCFHGSELVNVFDFKLALLGPGEPELAELFVKYWTNFAATGNPNGNGLPTWSQFSKAGGVANISTSAAGPSVTMVQSIVPANCAFWGNVTIPPAQIWGQA